MEINTSAIADTPHTCVEVITLVRYPDTSNPTTAPAVPALERKELTDVRVELLILRLV